jgi:hypothetical protein
MSDPLQILHFRLYQLAEGLKNLAADTCDSSNRTREVRSGQSSAKAEALRLLGIHGLFRITSDSGDGVTGTWVDDRGG